ncbi:alpha/beta-hydrolase [Stipitochalara longipes BDJ]|nr:alpha/beta-hydrolase [Stipitochalara longipes BDJ]
MAGHPLTLRTEVYLQGPDATELNTIDVWTSGSDLGSESDNKIWVVYIHGGAWRDPKVDSRSFAPAVEVLSNSSLKDSIAGFASVNYRLSPYPSHPMDPSSPDNKARNVHYPAHLMDVSCALLYLDDKYKINDRYIVAGHSAGACLAFELNDWFLPGTQLPQPACVLGISGIYDLEAFIDAHSEIPAYRTLIENAFPDKNLWEEASPNKSDLSKTAKWQNAKAVIVSHSDEDELVEKAQASYMLKRARIAPSANEKVYFLPATGAHDEIWESGHILAGLITKSIKIFWSSPKGGRITA